MNKLTVIENNEMQESNPIVLERLYEALDMAKEGGIDMCMVIMVTHDGYVVDAWANGKQPFVMVGAIEALKFDFIHSQIDQR